MPNRNIFTATGSLAASSATVSLPFAAESLYIRNADATNTITCSIDGQVVSVGPAVVKKVDKITKALVLACSATADYHIVALEDGDARYKFKAAAGASTPDTPVQVSSGASDVAGVVSICDTTGGTITITLQLAGPADLVEGQPYTFIDTGNAGTNTITLTAPAGKTVNGGASISIAVNGGAYHVIHDGLGKLWAY